MKATMMNKEQINDDWSIDITNDKYIESSVIRELREIDNYLIIIHNFIENEDFYSVLIAIKKLKTILRIIN